MFYKDVPGILDPRSRRLWRLLPLKNAFAFAKCSLRSNKLNRMQDYELYTLPTKMVGNLSDEDCGKAFLQALWELLPELLYVQVFIFV